VKEEIPWENDDVMMKYLVKNNWKRKMNMCLQNNDKEYLFYSTPITFE